MKLKNKKIICTAFLLTVLTTSVFAHDLNANELFDLFTPRVFGKEENNLIEVTIGSDLASSWRSDSYKTRSQALRREDDFLSFYYELMLREPTNANSKEYFSYNLSKVVQWIEEQRKVYEFVPEDASLKLEGDRVVEFNPGQTGQVVDVMDSAIRTIRSLEANKNVAIINVSLQKPKKELSETNDLGIVEVVATGTSTFGGSSKNRRHNIKAGTKKIAGTIIKPGGAFSFNDTLGDVTAATGFVPEIVIKKEGLRPEFGGGLCQVSSTLFRSVMNSGMKITNRRNHSFAVAHYKPFGTDATIYAGPVDFEFVNDTPRNILIWAETPNNDTLVFKIYGTKDDRIVDVKKPIQYDWKPDGSLKAEWSRDVTLNGKTRTDTYKSNYLPPALFKKEEQFVKQEDKPTPTTPPTEQTPPVDNGLMKFPTEDTTTN